MRFVLPLLASVLLAETSYAVVGLDGAKLAGGTATPSVTTTTLSTYSSGKKDWTDSMVAVYLCESGSITDNAEGTTANDLTMTGTVTADTNIKKEGSSSCAFDASTTDSLSCSSSTCTGVTAPGSQLTIAGWYYFDSACTGTDASDSGLAAKTDLSGSTGYSLQRDCTGTDAVSCRLGSGTGTISAFDSAEWDYAGCSGIDLQRQDFSGFGDSHDTPYIIYKLADINDSNDSSTEVTNFTSSDSADFVIEAGDDADYHADSIIIDDAWWSESAHCMVASCDLDGGLCECDSTDYWKFKACTSNSDCNSGNGICGDGFCTGRLSDLKCTITSCNQPAPYSREVYPVRASNYSRYVRWSFSFESNGIVCHGYDIQLFGDCIAGLAGSYITDTSKATLGGRGNGTAFFSAYNGTTFDIREPDGPDHDWTYGCWFDRDNTTNSILFEYVYNGSDRLRIFQTTANDTVTCQMPPQVQTESSNTWTSSTTPAARNPNIMPVVCVAEWDAGTSSGTLDTVFDGTTTSGTTGAWTDVTWGDNGFFPWLVLRQSAADECFFDDIAWNNESICYYESCGIDGSRCACSASDSRQYASCNTDADCQGPDTPYAWCNYNDNLCNGWQDLMAKNCTLPACDHGAPVER